MSRVNGTAEDLVDLIKAKAPATLSLLTAETDEQFDAALESFIAFGITQLEMRSGHFAILGEVPLTSIFILALSVPGLLVSQEMHSNGHVDITISENLSSPPRIRLGEAKIYSGYQYHVKGLSQLIGRYSTGREGRGLMIAYHKRPNIAGAIKHLRIEMDKELPNEQEGPTQGLPLRWSFLSTHCHSSGESFDVAHYGCNMYSPTTSEVSADSTSTQKDA